MATKTVDFLTAQRAGEREFGSFFRDSIAEWADRPSAYVPSGDGWAPAFWHHMDDLRERLAAFFDVPVTITPTGEDTADVTFTFDTDEEAVMFTAKVL